MIRICDKTGDRRPETGATALLPDHPPARFIWRHVNHKVIRADGPERITFEWWHGDEKKTVRDYYRLETDQGGRYWIFRDVPANDGGRWWLHGMLG